MCVMLLVPKGQILKSILVPKDVDRHLVGLSNILLISMGDLSQYKNLRGVQLLSIPSKVCTRIILERIKKTVEATERTGSVRIGEIMHKSNGNLTFHHRNVDQTVVTAYMNYIDFQKAFDIVNREVL